MPDFRHVTPATVTKYAGVAGLFAAAGYYLFARDNAAFASELFFTALSLGGVSWSQAQTHAQLRGVKADLLDIRENPGMPGTPPTDRPAP